MIDPLPPTTPTRSSDRTAAVRAETLDAVEFFARQYPLDGDPLRLLQLMAAHCEPRGVLPVYDEPLEHAAALLGAQVTVHGVRELVKTLAAVGAVRELAATDWHPRVGYRLMVQMHRNPSETPSEGFPEGRSGDVRPNTPRTPRRPARPSRHSREDSRGLATHQEATRLAKFRESTTAEVEHYLKGGHTLTSDAVQLLHFMADNAQRYRGRAVYAQTLQHMVLALDPDFTGRLANDPVRIVETKRALAELRNAGAVLRLPATTRWPRPTFVLIPRPGDTAATMTTADPQQHMHAAQAVAEHHGLDPDSTALLLVLAGTSTNRPDGQHKATRTAQELATVLDLPDPYGFDWGNLLARATLDVALLRLRALGLVAVTNEQTPDTYTLQVLAEQTRIRQAGTTRSAVTARQPLTPPQTVAHVLAVLGSTP